MDKEQTTKALDDAHATQVAKLYQDRAAAGDNPEAKRKFEADLATANRVHEDAVRHVKEGDTEKQVKEEDRPDTDDNYRKRLIPIAGSEANRKQIENAKGEELDRLGQHYNQARAGGLIQAPPSTGPGGPRTTFAGGSVAGATGRPEDILNHAGAPAVAPEGSDGEKKSGALPQEDGRTTGQQKSAAADQKNRRDADTSDKTTGEMGGGTSGSNQGRSSGEGSKPA